MAGTRKTRSWLTLHYLPLLQKLKSVACLSVWKNHALHFVLISLMGRVAASCGVRVVYSGSWPCFTDPEAGVVRQIFLEGFSFGPPVSDQGNTILELSWRINPRYGENFLGRRIVLFHLCLWSVSVTLLIETGVDRRRWLFFSLILAPRRWEGRASRAHIDCTAPSFCRGMCL